jgi:spermidine synthase
MLLLSGLGIGTTPSALISHGIDTTVVEIDPIVRNYALKYFSLSENHIPVIEDAVNYAARTAKDAKQRFDYIVHDVFTGGVEPVELFTTEFFHDLHAMLKPNGAIAIVSPIFCNSSQHIS